MPSILQITYYAATIYQNEIQLDPLTSRILAACNGTGQIWYFRFAVKHLTDKMRRILHGIVDRSFHNREVWTTSIDAIRCGWYEFQHGDTGSMCFNILE